MKRFQLLPILLGLSILSPVLVSAQYTREITGRIVFSTATPEVPNPNDPNRCGIVPVVEFDHVPGATSYSIPITDAWKPGLDITKGGTHDQFVTSFKYVGMHYVPPGVHWIGLSGLSTPQGCDHGISAYDGRFTAGTGVANLPAEPPIAAFTYFTPELDPMAVYVDGSASTTPTGTLVSYEWDFGDGEYGTGITTDHVYAEDGLYSVKLTVTNDAGLGDFHRENVTVEGQGMDFFLLAVEDEVVKGDTVTVIITVKNVGVDTITNVRILKPPLVSSDNGGDAIWLQGPIPGVIPSLDKNQSGEFVFRYLAISSGMVTFSLSELDVVGEFGQEEIVAENACVGIPQNENCDNNTLIQDPQLNVAILLKTDKGVTSTVKSGLTYVNGSVSFFSALPDGTTPVRLICRSGCIDLEVTVTNSGNDEPVEGAEVRLSAPLLSGANVVTTDQGGGVFCKRQATTECDRLLVGTTNQNGVFEAVYLVPGIIEDQPVNLTAVSDKDGYRAGDKSSELTILANRIIPGYSGPGSITITSEDRLMLESTSYILAGVNTLNAVANACKKVAGTLLKGTRSVTIPSLQEIDSLAIDEVCRNAPTVPLIGGALGKLKTLSELAQVKWFLENFQIQGSGLSTYIINPSPTVLVDVNSDFYKAILAAIKKIFDAPISGVTPYGTVITLEVFEVSYIALVDIPFVEADFTSPVQALYFSVEMETPPPIVLKLTHKTRVDAGYNANLWLLPPPTTSIYSSSLAGAAKLNIDSQNGFIRGDFIRVGSGETTEEINQIKDFGSFILMSPLMYSHDAGEQIVRLDSGIVSVPAPPFLVSPASSEDSVSTSSVLSWTNGSRKILSSNYALQVAADESFTTRVTDEQSLSGFEYFVTGLTMGETYYWRVRGTNEVGPGPWSPISYFTIGTTGVGVEKPLVDETTPTRLELLGNYPNPFNPQTTIAFVLPSTVHVRLGVFDVLGRHVATLLDGVLGSGRHETVFHAGDVPTGVYFYRLETPTTIQVRQMLLLR